MATRFAEKTTVSSADSRAEIERTLARYGAQRFTYGQNEDEAVALLGFRLDGRMIRFRIPVPVRPIRVTKKVRVNQSGATRTKALTDDEIDRQHEQAVRQRWRALLLIIKAKLEAVEAGITTVEDEFLSQTLLDSHTTIGEWVKPQLDEIYRTGGMPSLLPGAAPKALPGPSRGVTDSPS